MAKPPTAEQRKLEAAYTAACKRAQWNGDPDALCMTVAKRLGVPPKAVRSAVFACEFFDNPCLFK
jgi:hypothetical protein